ncbi:MAG: nucleotidyltransferase family protein [Prevotella sp.]|nr:nucleotidyltransferase family protein [Prevotella sp.]
MKKREVLFRLLRASLWGESLKPVEMPTAVYRSLMSMADMQTVSGLIGEAMMSGGVTLSKYDAIDLYTRQRAVAEQNESLDEGVARLARLLNENAVSYVIVKGQTLATLYPQPRVRIPGDIDVYVTPSGLERLSGILKDEWGLELPPKGSGKHVSVEYNGTELEVHHRLNDFASKVHQRYWDGLYDTCFSIAETVDIGGTPVKKLPPTLEVLFVFVHMYYHLLVLGCGLRQLIDVGMVLHAYRDRIDAEALQAHLHGIGMYDAFCAVGHILVGKIGLSAEDFPFEIESWHKKYEQRILDDMFYRGNFGKYHRKVSGVGWWHTLETGWIIGSHCLKFFRLSPKEILALYPKHIASSLTGKLRFAD